ncbi:protein kinase family protein [Demetria terragena]|uniref:protein kinase family protein n=1 Tax=Demetria terragena TaxID=63959 RepID=UPI00035EB7F4|nr:protein kinase family protein [Demetria terragena]
MDGISRGTVLGGRYTLQQALSSRNGVEQWVASDGTLGRETTVTVFAADHPHASAALDSARRIAGVEDRRLAQVLDVGTESEPTVSYVITEATHHSHSVAALLREGTLPAEEVRRIVGEAAVALETARQRGLHHQTLSPHEVLRSSDGAVQVSGVAVAAALMGRDDDDGDSASRQDVRALVRVAYAGLTARWPGESDMPGVESVDRRADGQLPAPSELVGRVPGDLDTLCRTVLSADEGPRTPGELARQLSPWSAERVHGAGGRSTEAGEPSRDGRRLATGTSMTGASIASKDAIGQTDHDSTDPGSLDQDDEPTMIGRRPQFDQDETSAYPISQSEPEHYNADPYHEEDLEPPLPLLAHGTEEPDSRSSRLALAIVAAVVVLALFLGFLGLRGLFSPSEDTDQAAQPSTATKSAQSGTPSAKTTPAKEVDVASVSTFAPGGTGNEHGWEAENVIDDDPETVWETRYYRSQDFSDGGPGLVLNLGKPTKVSKVTVDVNGAAIDATVLTADNPTEGDEMGTFSGDGKQTVSATSAPKVQYVIVRVSKLGTQDSGQNRARIGEVSVFS